LAQISQRVSRAFCIATNQRSRCPRWVIRAVSAMSARCPDCRRERTLARHHCRSQKCQIQTSAHALFDHLVGAGEQRCGHIEAERLVSRLITGPFRKSYPRVAMMQPDRNSGAEPRFRFWSTRVGGWSWMITLSQRCRAGSRSGRGDHLSRRCAGKPASADSEPRGGASAKHGQGQHAVAAQICNRNSEDRFLATTGRLGKPHAALFEKSTAAGQAGEQRGSFRRG
jgi:hypothetical protein